MRTWHVEIAVVGIALAIVTTATGGSLVDWVAALAVLLTFGHAQIADRLAEREAVRSVVTVECHHRARHYFIAKELCWCLVFAMHRAWPALVGVGLFLAYPMWRKWWRKRRPLEQDP